MTQEQKIAILKRRDVILKNKEKSLMTISSTKEEYYFILNAKNEHNEDLGYLSFKIKNRNCYIIKIEITNLKYAHLGLGSNMIKFMEDYALENHCETVDGKFYPFGELGKFAKNFYLKHKYKIEKEGYETLISKYLRKSNTQTLQN